jgi:hypothetical protein
VDDREVVARVGADELGGVSLAARQRHDEARRAARDVRVGDDVPVRVVDDPRAQSLRGLDLHDHRRHARDDVGELLLDGRHRSGLREDDRRRRRRPSAAGEEGSGRRDHRKCSAGAAPAASGGLGHGAMLTRQAPPVIGHGTGSRHTIAGAARVLLARTLGSAR